MKKLASTAATGLLLASMAMSASAASYSFDFTIMEYERPKPSFSYDYADGQSLNVSGVSGQSGPNQIENVWQWGRYGLYVDGDTHLTTNVSNNQWNYQALILDFGQMVSLNSIDITYTATSYVDSRSSSDNFLSVLAMSDMSQPLSFDTTWEGLVTDKGWTYAGEPEDYQYYTEHSTLNVKGGLLSRYWLVGAYNPAFGGETYYYNNGLPYLDGFKLGGVGFNTFEDVSEIPLPAAAWLFLTGLAGMAWMKKRKAKQSSELQVA